MSPNLDTSRPVRLLAQVRLALRRKHYSYRTETTYVQWIRRYIHFHNRRHPADMAEAEVAAFFQLAVEHDGLISVTARA